MKIGLYAGSFDPWSIGHQYVLDKALTIFDAIHVVVAVHPSKQSKLDADTRARLVAHATDPVCDWWLKKPPYVAKKQVIVTTHDGLIADYAKRHNIQHLIRGLRSTTDFEAEFNLYFANQAIDSSLQTWAIMCPPKLLHCSSTYIRAVIGKPNIKFVGTSFTAQAIMLDQPRLIGQLYDLFCTSEALRLPQKDFENFMENMQLRFSNCMQKKIKITAAKTKFVHKKLHNEQSLQDARVYEALLKKFLS